MNNPAHAVALVLLTAAATPLAAAPAAVPGPLEPWVPWVLEGHPDVACPPLDEAAACVWPGRLRLDLDGAGGSFRLDAFADADAVVELPGDAFHWPSGVTVDGRAALLRRQGSTPAVEVGAGRHQIAGRFRWTRQPESLAVPPTIAIVDLRLEDRDVVRPRREDNGRLWLGEARDEAEEADRLRLEVHRLLSDGVPLKLETRIVFYVSGAARAVELPGPLPEVHQEGGTRDGFVVTGLGGELPARWLDGDRLLVRVRPGVWELTLKARSLGPVAEIPFGERPAPWPREELWSFRAAPKLRAVEIRGAPGIDPRRTALPATWQTFGGAPLPAYRLTPGRRLHLEELSRGAAAPSDLLRVARRIWLTEGGRTLVAEDILDGQVYTAGRLEALAPGELGRVRLERRLREPHRYRRPSEGLLDQVLTASDEVEASAARPGVTVPPGPLYLQAETVYPRGSPLPAVGWNHDAAGLKIDLQLPLGWTLLAAWGADHAAGSWSDGFRVLDLLLLLLIGFFTWHRTGLRRTGLQRAERQRPSESWNVGLGWRLLKTTHHLRPFEVMLAVFFVLSLQEPFGRTVAVAWLVFLLSSGAGAAAGAARRTSRWLAAVAGAVMLVVFAAVQWRTGFHPEYQLPMPWAAYNALAEQGLSNPGTYLDRHPAEDAWWNVLDTPGDPRKADPDASREPDRSADLEEVAQTGFGIPFWLGRTCRLSWDGRVSADQELRLWLLSPAVELMLSVLRALAAVALAAWLFGRRGEPPFARATPEASTAVLLTAGLAGVLSAAGVQAQETAAAARPPAPLPVRGLLAELEERLTRPAPCHPACVEVALLELAPQGDELRLTAEVHAAAAAAWRLPGPAASWTPQRVTVNGSETFALRRDGAGFLALRLPAGRHRVEASGPAADAVDLEMPLTPRRLDFAGEGWMLSGTGDGEPPPRAVRLDRLPSAADADSGETPDRPFDPWLELHRRLVVGRAGVTSSWQIHSELRRRGSGDGLVGVRVPLLAGETVTSPGVTVEDGEAWMHLEPGQNRRVFRSQLPESETLRLRAPDDRPWFERWELDCSPIWSCQAQGFPRKGTNGTPPGQLQDPLDPTAGTRTTVWRPWPGEELHLAFSRPRPAGGPTSAVDLATFVWTPGARQSRAHLTLFVRTSVAGERVISLPAGAELESFTVGDEPRAMRFANGRLHFTLPPGEHEVAIRWTEAPATGWLARPPGVAAGAVANVRVEVQVPPNRRVLMAGGPGTGPVIESWAWLLLTALIAVVLRRGTRNPHVAVHEWLLLAAGLLPLPPLSALLPGYLPWSLGLWWPPWPLGPLAFAAVATWLVLSSNRVSRGTGYQNLPRRSWALALLGTVAVASLGAAVAVGLDAESAAHVRQVSPEGIPLTHGTLAWYVDRAEEDLPRPWVLWLPSWAWRGLVLAWALWLAGRLTAWSPWLFRGPRPPDAATG